MIKITDKTLEGTKPAIKFSDLNKGSLFRTQYPNGDTSDLLLKLNNEEWINITYMLKHGALLKGLSKDLLYTIIPYSGELTIQKLPGY